MINIIFINNDNYEIVNYLDRIWNVIVDIILEIVYFRFVMWRGKNRFKYINLCIKYIIFLEVDRIRI